MKLAILAAVATLAAVPALAQTTVYSGSGTSSDVVVTTPPADSPSMDARTATANAARESYYENKLDAAKAQAKADEAIAQRDAAEDRAADDRDVARDAEDDR